MYTRYILYFPLKILMFFVALLLAPVLPIFASLQQGKTNNGNATGIEPRLPTWLSWFMTPYNSLWGDKGWQTIHCPVYKSYFGKVKWLWRNPVYGFSWSVLAYRMIDTVTFITKHSGSGLSIDKSKQYSGWFYIKASNGAFQYRWVKVNFDFSVGWLQVTFCS